MQTQHSVTAHTALSLPAGANLPFVYLTIANVTQAVGLSTSRIYALIKQGEFPTGDLIGAQSRRWKSTDLAAWLIAQSEKAAQREADLGAPLKKKADQASQKSALTRRQRKAQEAGHVAL